MLFALKKLIGVLLMPCPLSLVLSFTGLALISRGRPGLGQRLAWSGAALFLLFAYRPVSWWLLHSLEAPYRIVADAASVERPEAIVVLGGGYHRDPAVPANFRLGPVTTVRLVEGIRLWHLFPTAQLIVSGGLGQAEALAETAAGLGVPPDRIEKESASWDTADEARLLRERLRGRPFLLVTSASHMARSVALFRGQGLKPTPAPADFLATSDPDGLALLPSGSGLVQAERALHEEWGTLWLLLRGQDRAAAPGAPAR